MYQVWTKGEYDNFWARNACKDLTEAKEAILQAAQLGKEPLLTQEVDFSIEVKIKPVKEVLLREVEVDIVAKTTKLPEEAKRGAKERESPPDNSPGG